jgi:hypothetical protein
LMAMKVGIPLRIGVFIGGKRCCNLVELDNKEQGDPDPLEGGPQGKRECEGIVCKIPTRSSADLACGWRWRWGRWSIKIYGVKRSSQRGGGGESTKGVHLQW